MSYAKRIVQLPTPHRSYPITLFIVAVLLEVALTACGAPVHPATLAQTAPLAHASALAQTAPPTQPATDPRVAAVRQRSALWNTAFAQRNTDVFDDLFAEDAQLTSGGGKWHGHSEVTSSFAFLWNHRDNISWTNVPTDMQVSFDPMVASETGHWTEAWNELDGKNVKLQGTYTMLWKRDKSVWRVAAAIFFPMTCTGESSYCKPPK